MEFLVICSMYIHLHFCIVSLSQYNTCCCTCTCKIHFIHFACFNFYPVHVLHVCGRNIVIGLFGYKYYMSINCFSVFSLHTRQHRSISDGELVSILSLVGVVNVGEPHGQQLYAVKSIGDKTDTVSTCTSDIT